MHHSMQKLTTITGLPLLIAHRGLSWSFPENTLPSYQAAITARADLVELDFRPTSDGILVCAHDPTIGRYIGKDAPPELRARPFSSFTLSQLRQFDLGSWKSPDFAGTPIPTLAQVLELFFNHPAPAPILLLEHKEGTPQQTLALLQQYHALEQVIVQSFDWGFLTEIHTLAPTLPLAALGSQPLTPQRIVQLQATGASLVHWHELSLRQDEIKLLHQAGLPVWAYTLNSETAWRGALAIGLDGITTDRCDLARHLLEQWAPQSPRADVLANLPE